MISICVIICIFKPHLYNEKWMFHWMPQVFFSNQCLWMLINIFRVSNFFIHFFYRNQFYHLLWSLFNKSQYFEKKQGLICLCKIITEQENIFFSFNDNVYMIIYIFNVLFMGGRRDYRYLKRSFITKLILHDSIFSQLAFLCLSFAYTDFNNVCYTYINTTRPYTFSFS